MENGYIESFDGKLHDKFLHGAIFDSRKEIRILAEHWNSHYNTTRPRSSLGYANCSKLRGMTFSDESSPPSFIAMVRLISG